MKILMLGWELPPHNSGGLGVASLGIARSLADSGHKIDFVLPYQDDSNIDFMTTIGASPLSADKIQIWGAAYDSSRYDEYEHLSRAQAVGGIDLARQRLIYNRFVAKLAGRRKFDIIHAHDWMTLEAGAIAKQISGKPLIAHVHATEFDRSGEHYGNPFVHEIEEQGLLLADHIIAVSQHTKDVIVENYHIPADKITVVHNAINPDEYGEIQLTDKFIYLQQMKRRGYKVMVNVGRLTVQKGLQYLLKTFAEVKKLEPKSLLLLVGSGELYHELIELSADLGVSSSVIFAGFQRGQTLRQAYAVGDVFVMPSVSEPFGITPLEAASCHVPVVMSKTSGVGEVLRSSFRVDYWDTLAMADRIVNLFRSTSLSQAMSDTAYNEFANMSWQQVADKCNELYTRALRPSVRSAI